ncbi:hypothetical protein SAMN05216266_10879 [Amycolatopsis marina]|uniref:Excreted virulence factor EspC, type VII ESX diderm n=1 Tax=Amycolatopsis marina TaxID=490629 RepID=A0A1I1A4Q1_9PSEU|nr:hypothetical protein [Amycolatopsis marina]SFB31558.1 hypothetical protein SAMN05216266_10879 [Amycolatopsis marina]
MAGGHSVETDGLALAAGALNDVPRRALETPLRAVKDVQIGPADFGRAHGECSRPYTEGVMKLAACAETYLAAAEEFGNRFDSAGAQYVANEDQAAGEMGRY